MCSSENTVNGGLTEFEQEAYSIAIFIFNPLIGCTTSWF